MVAPYTIPRLMRQYALASIALVVLRSPFAAAQHLSADGGTQTFNFLADQYFSEVYFRFSPTAGTSAGLHQYDTQLEDYSAAAVQREIRALHAYEKKIDAIDPSALDASVAADRDILLNNIRSQLLTLEVIRPWEKNPDIYSSGVTNSIFVIMERPYASTDTRLRAAVEREKLIPQVFSKLARTSRTRRASIPRSPSSRSTATSASFRTTFPPPFSLPMPQRTPMQSRVRKIERRCH